jgi:hypothetical protein
VSGGDEKFEAYLAGKSLVSEKYAELRDVEPPEDLDAVILAEAARAAKTHSHATPTRRWVIPVSVAATVMICFSLVWNILREVPTGIATDQAVDALIPADRFDAPASLESLSAKARPAAPAEKKASVSPDSVGRVAESAQILPQAVVQSPGRLDKDDRQAGATMDEAAASGGREMSGVTATASKPQERIADASLSMSRDRLEATDSDQLTALGQMMEVVTDYLYAEAAEAEESIYALASPVADGLPAAQKAETSAYSGMASLSSVEEKPGSPEPERTNTEEAASVLRRIAEMYTQSQNDKAAEALAEFRQAYPDHQVSRTLLERGY